MAEINALNSGYQVCRQISLKYSKKIYQYQLTVFYGITISPYKSFIAFGAVAPATVSQATAVQQTRLKVTGPQPVTTLKAPEYGLSKNWYSACSAPVTTHCSPSNC
ncbi:hypothetical protein [Pseudomonas sp. BW7P1]|uniref:hypothetical protein n=1 Tax=Pseudomonas TaxID=286 RepID=UPI0021AD7B8F|nr:hypothetical protein [Pseudomonas sp. BW7P1]UWI60257.1 hypothetical protein NWV16_19385 [Pseudomonas sp. BW7P1]